MVMDPLLATPVLKLDPVKEDPEKAAAWATKKARRREAKDFIVFGVVGLLDCAFCFELACCCFVVVADDTHLTNDFVDFAFLDAESVSKNSHERE